MALIDNIIARAQSNRQRIVLPESLEERTIKAADMAIADALADIILIGNRDEILAYADKLGLRHIGEATIIDPATSDKTEEYAQLLFKLREKKGMTLEKAFNLYEVDYEGLVRNFTRFHRYHFKTPGELSGGETRVAEMYLVLMSDVPFCILDEPFAQIAPIHAEKMKELIAEQKEKKGIIVSDHLYESIIEVADDLFVIDGGYTCPVHAREDLVRHGYLPR